MHEFFDESGCKMKSFLLGFYEWSILLKYECILVHIFLFVVTVIMVVLVNRSKKAHIVPVLRARISTFFLFVPVLESSLISIFVSTSLFSFEKNSVFRFEKCSERIACYDLSYDVESKDTFSGWEGGGEWEKWTRTKQSSALFAWLFCSVEWRSG